jgi:nucleotide-binding universal stress UspA family protein
MPMRKLIAALDNSLAAGSVLATADGLARLFAAEVEAVHVGEDHDRIPSQEATAAGLQLRRLEGATVPALVQAGEADDVVAVVLGTRRLPLGGRPIGATAFEVITSLLKPVVVVPPDAPRPPAVRRALVPLEGTLSTSLAPKGLVELAHDASIDIVILHVLDAAALPAFTDQPQHEARAWCEEFVARHCPWGVGKVSLEVRVGRPEEQILAAASELGADLIVLGWAQELEAGRAPTVREVLERGHTPVLLIPVHLPGNAHRGRSESWNSLQSLHV